MVRHGAGGRRAGPAAHQQDAGHDRREVMTNFGAHERYLQGLAEMPDREGPPDQAAVAQGTSLQPGQKPRALAAWPCRGRGCPRLSTASGPVLLHPGNGLVLAHRRHFSLIEMSARDEQVHQICGECSGRRFGCPAVRLDAILYERPEGRLVYVKLISENMAPDFLPVAVAVHRMRDPRSQDSPVVEVKFAGDVMRSGLALRVSHRLPPFGRAKCLMVLARRRWPGHRAGPASQSRSCSSSLRLIS